MVEISLSLSWLICSTIVFSVVFGLLCRSWWCSGSALMCSSSIVSWLVVVIGVVNGLMFVSSVLLRSSCVHRLENVVIDSSLYGPVSWFLSFLCSASVLFL